MTFTQSNHSYIDSEKKRYMSVTTLVKLAFEAFDAEKAAKQRAARTGEDPEQLMKEWEELGKISSANGTRCHEFAEHYIRDRC